MKGKINRGLPGRGTPTYNFHPFGNEFTVIILLFLPSDDAQSTDIKVPLAGLIKYNIIIFFFSPPRVIGTLEPSAVMACVCVVADVKGDTRGGVHIIRRLI